MTKLAIASLFKPKTASPSDQTTDSKQRRGGYFVWIALFIALLAQLTIFHLAVYRSWLISSLWHHPIEFYTFWWPKVGAALFLSSFALLSRRKWWTVAIPVVLGLYGTANYIYYYYNLHFLTLQAMGMVDNLNGFWDSVWAKVDGYVIGMMLVPLVYALALIPLRAKRRPKSFFAIGALVLLLHLPGGYLTNRRMEFTTGEWKIANIVPWEFSYRAEKNNVFGYSSTKYNGEFAMVMGYSLAHLFPHTIVQHFTNRYWTPRVIAMLEEERNREMVIPQEARANMLQTMDTLPTPRCSMVLMLIESLEGWVIDATDEEGRPIAPNLRRLANEGLYCPRLRSQDVHGRSGDGQMIINTGLLPLLNGVACRLYADNKWPNWAGLFERSATQIPTLDRVWNQREVTPAYGYQTLYAQDGLDDMETMLRTATYTDTVGLRPFAFQALTVYTHTPFRLNHPAVLKLEQMPNELARYLECVHYCDSCIGVAMERISLEGTIVVITGDHTCFNAKNFETFHDAAQTHGYDIASGESFTPLIIVGDGITPRQVDDTCYQMDIYPTIMHAIGCEHYYWKGFGANLLAEGAPQRKFSAEEASHYSNLIIHGNWLAKGSPEELIR